MQHLPLQFHGSIRLSQPVADKLRAHHLAEGKSVESCSFVLGHAYSTADGHETIVLADPDAVLLFAKDCFVSKSYGHVSLHKDVKAQVFMRAIEQGYTAVVDVHDHHFTTDSWFSSTDDRDDLANANYVCKTVQEFMPKGKRLVAAAMLLTRGTWAARRVVQTGGKQRAFVDLRVDEIGKRLNCLSVLGTVGPQEVDKRHAGLIGAREREMMHTLRIAVVGAGGTGTIVLEGLLRSGFKRVSIIDADLVEASNLNRLQGCSPSDIGLPKVDVLARRASQLVPDAQVIPVVSMAVEDAGIAALRAADIIVGCVDNRDTRWWLNRFSVQYMVPWFDCGVILHTKPSVFHEFHVSSVLPGTLCCGHCGSVEFFPRSLPTQFMDLTTLAVQRAAGYIKDEPEAAAPSAYLVNMQAVGALLEEILNWVCGWREPASSLFKRSDEAVIERIDSSVTDLNSHVDCPVCGILLGKCDEERLARPSLGIDFGSVAERFATDAKTSGDRLSQTRVAAAYGLR